MSRRHPCQRPLESDQTDDDRRRSTTARPPSCGPSSRSTSRRPSRSARATSPRARRQRVVGHRAQRHGHARAGGLPRTSPTPAPAGCRPRRATGSSSTRSTGPAALGAGDAKQVRTFFAEAHGELEQMLPDTSRLLSSLTQLRRGRRRPAARGRHRSGRCSSSALAPRVALLVVGAVERRRSRSTPSSSTDDVDDASLAAAGARLAAAPRRPHAGRDRGATRRPPTGDAGDRRRWPSPRPSRPAARHRRRPTRSSSAAPRAWPRAFDAVGTVQRGAAASSSSSSSSSPSCATCSTAGLHVAIGTETGMEPLADCSVVVSPYEVEGEPAGTHRRARPDPHELPAGAGRRRRREPAARPPPERGLRWTHATDYYELLGVSPRRHRRRDQAGLPPAGPRAAPRRQPRRPRGRGAVQGGRRGLRDAERSRAPPALRPLRARGRGRRRCPAASAAAGSATSSTRSSAAAARSAAAGRAGRPAPRRRPRGGHRPRRSRRPCSAPRRR